MSAKPKGKSKKISLDLTDKQLQQLQKPEVEIGKEKFSDIRASRYGRQSRYAVQQKHLTKVEREDFHLRKALNTYVREELEQQARKTYFQRVFILARNTEFDKQTEENNNRDSLQRSSEPMILDYRAFFLKHMQKIFRVCELKKFTHDQLTGLFVCMGNYTFLMIEGAEDMMSDFFDELTFVHDELWTASKVFLVEDKIGETYFDCFHTRTSSSININEKFPTSTNTDKTLMSQQHFKIMEKVKTLAETFANQVLKSEFSAHHSQHNTADSFSLPADPYNKILPEIQRIDLVLSAHKFYRDVKDFAQTYRIMPARPDEDALFWPIQQNYTPLTIFERSIFDVNLTFGDYGKDEKKAENEVANANETEESEQGRASAANRASRPA